MNKRVFIFLLCLLSLVYYTSIAFAANVITPNEGLELVEKMVRSDSENIRYVKDIDKSGLYEYQSDSNYYYIDKESGELRIFSKKDITITKTDISISKDEATKKL